VPTCRSSAHHPCSGRHRSACAFLVASFAAGVMVSNGGERYGGHAGVLIATFRCAARRGAFADARRVMAGDAGGRAPTRKRSALPPGSAAPQAATSTELRFAQTHGKLCPRLQARLSVLIG
jgi:hypothetical protein